MKISVMICEDLEEERMALGRMVRACCKERQIDLALEFSASGEEILDRFRTTRWDIVFLDIYMGKVSGADAARAIRGSDHDCALVFATTSREHGLLSYELQISDYLLKPFARQDVEAALDWILREKEDRFRTLTIRTEWESETIRLRDIQYIEVLHHTAVLHLPDGIRRTRRGLRELEAELEGGSFLRCHRSFLVNLDHVANALPGAFEMGNGDRVPISTKRMPEMKKAFFEWSLIKNWGT